MIFMNETEIIRKMFISERRARIIRLVMETKKQGKLKKQFENMTLDQLVDWVIKECDKQ